ncbi:MAG TPA: monofunctional biosynthetic peptidoglycan transglycosylase [Chlorobaculum parvum]|uniref:Biosynthetic peptidoglycan transglycosylase n=1 Tax=Chlorobaculum parvum TaxID=274539 RepID=A0A7C5DFX6_9CHLB|nr:monofunctional biosynthetic peptidoglycan transglycosylase [Chlorobaculum parvum]
MKLLRNLFLFILFVLLVDVGRYLVAPNVAELKTVNPETTVFIKSRKAQWRRDGIDRTITQRWVPLSRVSPMLVKAVLIAEDDKFWHHEGFDYEAIRSAVEKDIEAREFRFGASTISQQLAKNLYLSPSKNPVRKLQEAILTWRLERTLSKRRILELYINIVEWGDGIFGIEAAAKHYYGISASQLTANQAARLAAVLPNPIRFKPNGTSRFVEKRARVIQGIMMRRGLVVPDYREVISESDTTGSAQPDSVVVGIPEGLIDAALQADSTAEKSGDGAEKELAPTNDEQKSQSGD